MKEYLEKHHENSENKRILNKLIGNRNRDVLLETLGEFNRKCNFERIYPARGTDLYDCYF